MLLFCDFKESDGLGICTLRVSVAPSGCEAVRVCLLLQQSWEGRIATGKGVYHIAAGRHFSFSGYLPSAAEENERTPLIQQGHGQHLSDFPLLCGCMCTQGSVPSLSGCRNEEH